MSLLVINRKISKDRDWSFNSKVPFRYLLYWPLFLLLTLLALIGSWLYLNLTTPLYKVNASILIKGQEESFKNIDAKQIIGNEVNATQSKILLQNIVKSLNLYAPVFKEERFKSVSAYTSSPVIVVAENDAIKEASKIYFTYNNNGVTLNRKRYRLNEWINASFSRIKFVKNTNYIANNAGTNFYFSLISPEKAASSIAARLKVIADPKLPENVSISFTDEVPLRGEAIVKEFIKGYNKLITDRKNTFTIDKARLIDEQIAMVENDLLAIENKLLSSRLPKKTEDYDGKQQAFIYNININDRKVSEINTKITNLNKIENAVQLDGLSGLTLALTNQLAPSDLTKLLKKLNQLQSDLEHARKTANNHKSPYTVNQEDIEKIKLQILTSLQKQRQRLQANRNSLLRKNNSYLTVLVSKLEKPKRLVDIQKEQIIKKNQYVSLLKQKEELALSTIPNSGGNQIVDNVASYPLNHNENSVYLGAVFTALITGFGIAVKKEISDSRIMSEKDIESITKLPIVGKIAVEKLKKEVFGSNTKLTNTAQFRKLRAMLNYLMLDSKQKRILITSAITGEGKSFIAMNLARNQALSGKKVVLLKFTSGQLKLINTLNSNLQNDEFKNYFEENLSFEKTIDPVKMDKNLFLLTIDKLSENFSLVKNAKLSELLNYLDQDFDCVIIDSPAIGNSPDAYTLSTLCDATLYIIKRGFTRKAVIEGLDKQNLSQAAIVFNGI